MKTKPTRVIFDFEGEKYKFLSYFPDKKDNSFYFHIYNGENEKMRIPGIPLEKRNDKMIVFDDFKETDFVGNKLSFHESGYIHSTDNSQERFKDGVIGISFKNIEISLLILIVAPIKIENLIKIDRVREQTDIVIALSGNITPFTINFEVFRISEMAKLDYNNPHLVIDDYILTEYEDKEFGLRLYLQKVLGDAAWPPFNTILKRIG
jgi:hypothetical protein